MRAICPSCGTADEVSGRRDAGTDDIRLTCGRCGASWDRGERRCATCGGRELTNRAQAMRRHSRGTQLSIVGWRDVVLCVRCDAEVLGSVGTRQTPIPEEYVSSALVDVHALPPTRPAPRPETRARHATGDDQFRSTQQPVASSRPLTPPPPPRSAPPPPSTVRLALQESLTGLAATGTTLDPTTVLLLGTHLGPTTRLDQLERAGHDASSLAEWAERTWGTGRASTAARHTLTALAEHWLAQGWTTTDLAAHMRPQEDA
jgi:hypothetical protein